MADMGRLMEEMIQAGSRMRPNGAIFQTSVKTSGELSKALTQRRLR
jgi:hypothetical protein